MASYRYERNIRPEDLVQEPPRVLTPQERRANWWHYHWYYVALILAALLAAGWYAWQNLTAVRPDYVVTVVSRTDPAPELLEQVQAQLEAVGSDENGDGKITVEVNGIWLDLSAMQEGGDFARLMESSQEKLNAAFYLGESTLFLVDDPAGLEQMYGCFRYLDGGDPQLNQASLSSLQRPSVRPHPAARRGLFVQSPPSNVRTKGRQTRADRAVRQPLCLLLRQGAQNPPPLPRQHFRPGRTNKKAARPFGLTAFLVRWKGLEPPAY